MGEGAGVQLQLWQKFEDEKFIWEITMGWVVKQMSPRGKNKLLTAHHSLMGLLGSNSSRTVKSTHDLSPRKP